MKKYLVKCHEHWNNVVRVEIDQATDKIPNDCDYCFISDNLDIINKMLNTIDMERKHTSVSTDIADPCLLKTLGLLVGSTLYEGFVLCKGDECIDIYGKKGVVEHVCFCEECKKRGFNEIAIRMEDDTVEYITNSDKEVDFNSWYKLGKLVIRDNLKPDIFDKLNNDIKIHTEGLKQANKQIDRLKKIMEKEDISI